ncbi:uncharacterized protein LOC103389105 [Cynoglossus semilaevis]|uniref:uncharacterized protein LOC103389105 n=1 Tax=Cynoglossus semilaevis TaxID=244447 RepID=UPI0004977D7B|nr:uncharacterized protein LOC103389105 [Cynoglossus semilaevis]
MDSGFLGSESSHFTGAVAPSLLHQVSSQRYNEHLIGEVRQCMKNLKEMMERKIQDEPSCEPPHYPHFRHAPPSSAMSWEDKESHRQPLSALSRRCPAAPLKVEPRSAESEHRESFLGHGSTLRSNRFNAPPPHSTSIPPPVQHLRTKLKEPKRSSPRHQVASQRPAKTSPPEEFGEVRRTVHTPMDTSCLLRQNKLLRQNSYSVSDDEHSDLHTGSVQSNYSSISSSTPTAPHHHHDDPFKVLDSTHPISHQCEAQGPIDDFNEVRRTAQSPPESVYKVRQTKLQQKSTADETDNRTPHHHRLIGSECWAHQRERSKRAAGGHDTPTHSSSVCCRLCPHRRDSNPDSLRQINHQPAVSSDGGTKKRPSAAAAPAPTSLPHCTLLGQPVLLYSLPLCLSPSKSTSTPLEVGGQRESEAGLRRCFSADQLCSLDLSLNRAIRAAQRMKHTSRHMARTQALGLQYQNLLSR